MSVMLRLDNSNLGELLFAVPTLNEGVDFAVDYNLIVDGVNFNLSHDLIDLTKTR